MDPSAPRTDAEKDGDDTNAEITRQGDAERGTATLSHRDDLAAPPAAEVEDQTSIELRQDFGPSDDGMGM